MKFPEFHLPKLKFRMDGDDWETYDAMDPTKKYQYRDVYKNQQLQRADEIYPETMTSRIIVVTIAALLSMVLAWYVLGFAQFSGIAFKNSVRDATGSNTSSAVSSSSGQVDSGSGAGSEAGVSESGSVESELARFEQQPDETPVQPRSLEEFRRMQCMDFDTYLRNYYQMVSPENAGLHWYLSSFTGDKYDWSEVYKIWEEITNNNYAAYMAMYNGSDDVDWKDGSSENYISADLGQEDANSNASGLGVASNSSSGSDKPGDLTMGGVSLKSCLRSIKLWKIFWTLMIGLLVWLIGYKIAERNLAVQNQGKDNRHLLQYPNDQHIQMPEEMQRNYDYFPDVGAHAPVQVASMISHVMLLNKGVKTVLVARRADSDIYSESGELLYNKGEILLDEDGEPIMDEMPMFDKKFGVALFNSAKVLDDKRARVFYSPAKIPYNPKNDNRDKLKNADKVSDMINKYWHFPEYEPQRPAGAYLVDTAPVNTMILAITRAGKGQTYIEPVLDMWTREDKPSNMVINDPKGELLVKFYVRGTVRGYQIVQFNLINIMKTDVYNPLGLAAEAAREGDFTKVAEYVDNIASVFFPVDGSQDPVWPNAANNAFKRTAYGMIDFYMEEEKMVRAQAAAEGWDEKTLETKIDALWGKVTLYNCYQLFVVLAAKKLKNPIVEFKNREKAGDFEPLQEGEDPNNLRAGRQPMNDDEFEAAKQEALARGKLWQGKAEDDLLTLFFNATSELPSNSIRRLVGNADNSLRSMAGAEKMLASVYGIAVTAMVRRVHRCKSRCV